METAVRSVGGIRGVIEVPGDKSISHRSVLLGAIGEGPSTIDGFLMADDPLSTVRCVHDVGVPIEIDRERKRVVVHGVGLRGLREPERALDCGNSGTTMRLLAGLLAGQPFFSVFTGDDSLRSRPMARVLTPLRAMGAIVMGRGGDAFAPFALRGGDLRAMTHSPAIASAQVKSALLLAGLYADGETVVTEPSPSRDHTERMLAAMGAPVSRDGVVVRVRRPDTELRPLTMRVPGDFSAAAFWLVAAACCEGSDVMLPNVGLNPTRTGALDVLQAMGAAIELCNERIVGGEPVADIRVTASRLTGVEIAGDLTLRAIDELPVLALAATQAEGTTIIRDAGELRVKESDRIETTVAELARLGADIRATDDGMVVRGRRGGLHGALCNSHGDHRLAMTLAMAGVIAGEETVIAGAEAADVSYPDFWKEIERLAS